MKRAHAAAFCIGINLSACCRFIILPKHMLSVARRTIQMCGMLASYHIGSVWQCATNTTQATTQFTRLLCDATMLSVIQIFKYLHTAKLSDPSTYFSLLPRVSCDYR